MSSNHGMLGMRVLGATLGWVSLNLSRVPRGHLEQRSSTTGLETFLLALFKADKPSSDVCCHIKFHFSASEQFCDLSLIKTKSNSS